MQWGVQTIVHTLYLVSTLFFGVNRDINHLCYQKIYLISQLVFIKQLSTILNSRYYSQISEEFTL